MIIDITVQRVTLWKSNHVEKGDQFNITREISDLIADSVLVCVFGQSSINKKVPFETLSGIEDIFVGEHMKRTLKD